ncbi:MAG: hypothetical protein L6R00_03060 [Phycisphaerae bacterium]|nr:hypothetical protein [Phycisphaerae bacterium]
MANGTRAAAAQNTYVLVALIIGVVVLVTPLISGMFESGERKLAREVEPGVERVQQLLERLDENLLVTQDLRRRLSESNVDLSAEASATAAEGKPELLEEIDDELQKGDTIRVDKLLASADSEWERLVGPADRDPVTRGLGGRGGVFGRQSFEKFQKLLTQNEALVREAEQSIKATLGLSYGDARAADDVWANQTAALVSLVKGRIERDRAWYDRWQAAGLRMVARTQWLDAVELQQSASAADGRAPNQAIEAATVMKTQVEAQMAPLKDAIAELSQVVDSRRAQIDSLRAEAAAANQALIQMDLTPFKASDPSRAVEEFKEYRQRYESLAQAARRAEAQAETLEKGALSGGSLSLDAEGDLLAGSYVGAEETKGLIELQTRLDTMKGMLASLEEVLKTTAARLDELHATARAADAERDKFQQLASERTEQARTTMSRIDELMASARAADDAALAAFKAGMQQAQAAQRAAQSRVSSARQRLQELAAEQQSERLTHVSGDRDTGPAVQVLAATLAWSAAETCWQAIADLQAQQLTAAAVAQWTGGPSPEPPSAALEELRTSSREFLASAISALNDAKTQIQQARYEQLEGPAIQGQNYKWQVSQLEGALHMMAALMASKPSDAEDDIAKARTALQEALQGREGSPLLSTAATALATLQ